MNSYKDLTRKSRKKINKRSKKGQGCFYSSHNYNRSTGFQSNSIGFSEYVLHSSNARSYNTRLNTNRTNLGYLKPRLKHISSQSIGREKEYSAIGCYEEYTLRRIRNTSDMIKQQLMSPENLTITREKETNMPSDNISLKVRSKQNRLSGETSKFSDNKEYSQTKVRRKPSKSCEEVARFQLKEKRKNELREKFKKDNISKQNSNEIYNVKEISDKIIQHISKMNNARLVDFLNSGNSRYEEAFSYICKEKSFELTKALRDLSRQQEPAACEIVNAIIPDFSIKIEELPIDIIRELSSTFDELHRNIDDSSLSGESLHLFEKHNLLQKNDNSLKYMQTDCVEKNITKNPNTSNETFFEQIKAIKQEELPKNLITFGAAEQIVIIDSDDESLPLNQDNSQSPDNIEERLESSEVIEVDLDSSSEQMSISTKICDTLPNIAPFSSINNGNVHSNFEHSSNIETEEPVFAPPEIDESSIDAINSNTNSPQVDDGFSEIINNDLGTTDSSLLESQFENNEMESSIQLEKIDLNTQPKVGSVWVSKNIFITTDILEKADEFCDASQVESSHTEDSDAIFKNFSTSLGETTFPSVEAKNMEDIDENLDSIKRPELSLDISHRSDSPSCIVETAGAKDNSLLNIASPLSSTTHGNSQHVIDTSNKNNNSENSSENISENSNKKKSETIKKAAIARSDKSYDMTNKDIPNVPQLSIQSDLTSNNSITDSVTVNNSENEFLSLTIKNFNKPKNLHDAINFMNVIDQKIEILTKLRRELFIELGEIVNRSENKVSECVKRKLNDSDNAATIKNKCIKTGKSSDKREQIEVKKPSKIKPFSNLKFIDEVVLFCKILYDKSEMIVGTDKGNIQYYNILYGKHPFMVVNIGESAISFLEYVKIYDGNFVCTGNTTELELKILKYKKRVIEQKIYLEDSIQAVVNEWGYFFIGGRRGYLTTYDWKSNKIVFEDRISEMKIKDLKATREGPRKILVILFEDPDGVAHVHVRDAMTALHIRTIVHLANVSCMDLRYSTLYLVRDGEIVVYNCCDGLFVAKEETNKSFSLMKFKGNLLLLGNSDGIYAFNMRTNKYLNCLQNNIHVSTLNFFNHQILCTTWEKKIELLDVAINFKGIMQTSNRFQL